jgi:hypothetical protein
VLNSCFTLLLFSGTLTAQKTNYNEDEKDFEKEFHIRSIKNVKLFIRFFLQEMCSDLFRLNSDLFRLVQTCSDLFSLVQTCSDLFRLVHTVYTLDQNKMQPSNFFTSFYLYQVVMKMLFSATFTLFLFTVRCQGSGPFGK